MLRSSWRTDPARRQIHNLAQGLLDRGFVDFAGAVGVDIDRQRLGDADVLRGRAERNEEFLKSLSFALEIAPVEILTNGRKYIRNHFEALRSLRDRHGDRLKLRITIESPDAAGHDAIRGRGTFADTVQTIYQFAAAGFVPVVTAECPPLSKQEDEQIRESYRSVLPGVEIEVNLIENMIETGHQLQTLARRGVAPRRKSSSLRNASRY